MSTKTREHALIAQRAIRVEAICSELGIGTLSNLFERAQDEARAQMGTFAETSKEYDALGRISEWSYDNCLKLLRFRGGKHYTEFIGLICCVFALVDPSTKPPHLLEKTNEYRRRIYDLPTPPIPGNVSTSSGPIALVRQLIPKIGEADGDLFYNASTIGLQAVVDQLPVERELMSIAQDGLLTSVLDSLARNRNFSRLFLQGRAGSGRSILLDQLTIKLIERKIAVYKCVPELINPATFTSELAQLLQTSTSSVVIIIEDAHKMNARGVDVSVLRASTLAHACSHSAMVILSDNWSVRSGGTPLDKGYLDPTDKLLYVTDLSKREIEELLDKIISAERSGIIKNIRSTKPRAERLAVIDKPGDRLAIIALLKLRYGLHVHELLQIEYNAISSNEIKHLYGDVLLLDSLGFTTPSRWVVNALRKAEIRIGASRLEQELFRREDYGFRIRHPALVVPYLQVVFPNADDRPFILSDFFIRIDLMRPDDRSFFVDLITSPGVTRRISQFVGGDPDLIRRFLELLGPLENSCIELGLGGLYFALRGTIEKDVLFDYGAAENSFNRAHNCDENNLYVRRQRCWTALRLGHLHEAEKRCDECIIAAADNSEAMEQCAFVMSWCSRSGFLKSGKLYSELNERGSLSSFGLRQYEKHQEAAAIVEYLHNEELQTAALEAMRAPAFIWRIRRGASKQLSKALLRELSGNLANDKIDLSSFTADDLAKAEFSEPVLKSDSRLRGLLKANIARILFEQHRDGEREVHSEELEHLFKEAMRLNKEDPFIVCWYGTFSKDMKLNYSEADRLYTASRALATKSKLDWVREHPMIANNQALLIMDGVYRQKYGPKELLRAYSLLKVAIHQAEKVAKSFRWPIVNMAQLRSQAAEFGIELPAEPASQPISA